MPSRFFPLYNIDLPVGPRMPNKLDDVLLVQALFIEVSRFDANDWLRDIPTESWSLATSGIFDDTLKQWIWAFQRWELKNFPGAPLKVDGIIHPMPKASPIDLSVHFKSGRISTLSLLCNRLWRHNRQAYLKIGDDYHVPWIPDGWKL